LDEEKRGPFRQADHAVVPSDAALSQRLLRAIKQFGIAAPRLHGGKVPASIGSGRRVPQDIQNRPSLETCSLENVLQEVHFIYDLLKSNAISLYYNLKICHAIKQHRLTRPAIACPRRKTIKERKWMI